MLVGVAAHAYWMSAIDVNRMFLTDSHGVRRRYELREPSSQGGFHLFLAHWYDTGVEPVIWLCLPCCYIC